MPKLTKILASALIVATALGAALPAQAQSWPRGYEDRDGRQADRDDRYGDRYQDRYDDRDDRYGDRYDRDGRNDYRGSQGQAQAIRVQIAELERRVERTDRHDRISEREAAGLRNAVYRLREQFRFYNRDGLSRREVYELRTRIDQIRSRLHGERHDWDGRRGY